MKSNTVVHPKVGGSPMLYFVLSGELEPEVACYALHHCAPRDYVVRLDKNGTVVFGLSNEDRAHLFLNLFEDDIEASFELDPGEISAAA